jgi:hypothetical protein
LILAYGSATLSGGTRTTGVGSGGGGGPGGNGGAGGGGGAGGTGGNGGTGGAGRTNLYYPNQDIRVGDPF